MALYPVAFLSFEITLTWRPNGVMNTLGGSHNIYEDTYKVSRRPKRYYGNMALYGHLNSIFQNARWPYIGFKAMTLQPR